MSLKKQINLYIMNQYLSCKNVEKKNILYYFDKEIPDRKNQIEARKSL